MTDVPLREYIERIIAEHDKAHQAEHFAVALQAKEYERRLDSLNHAHVEALRVQSTYLRADKYEDRSARVDADLEELKNFRSKAVLIATGLTITAGAFGAAVMRLLFGGGW